ncbi:hypothetical protein WDZ17_03685 [Pseudokineococcus basanitobsidens]|uniref:Methyltransferase family protein n=1 Tax=Pseudokineococcus basanitobsidens TaxID=1926649 RepID=A0ABU8RH21_9ACTN
MAPDWLALREPADVRARDAVADELLPALGEHLSRRSEPRPGRPLHVLDAGAGTGAGARWLAARLGTPGAGRLPTRWTLVDHDADLLDVAGRTPGATGGGAVRVVGDLDDAAGLVREGGAAGADRVDLLTATALLDLLRPVEADVLVGAALAADVPLLLSLSVTGEVALDPPHPDDAALGAAFDAHQRRGGRLGPDAAPLVVERLRAAGHGVRTAASPWLLGTAGPPGADDAALLLAWVRGRAAAAVEQDAGLADRAAAWTAEREAQVAAGRLGAVVGHVEVLALPAGDDRRG